MSYATPKQFHHCELLIKKSRFIAWAQGVDSREQAMLFLQKAKQQYPDARHHCWAYQIGPPQSATSGAMSDDGEPSGTAGKPIFNVLQHKNIGDVMVIVIRYFGGIKLGAGGLVRAYSGATEKVMSELPVQTLLVEIEKNIQVDFAKEQLIRHWLSTHNGRVVAVNYSQNVQMTVAVEQSSAPLLTPFLASI